ncbi:glycosyltransferase [Methylomonas sp. 2BW1-5-20]|uniref:glycosyltransferase n=1 Tax=Methylomonas sp. 2BW1-5-20 TaxID=3376686 RepID=UPI00404EA3F5
MTIYYLCPEHSTPVGGVRVIYQHVDVLNRNGIPAYVVHKTKGFRVNWFENQTPIVYWRDTFLDRLIAKYKRRSAPNRVVELPIKGGQRSIISASDILVIPEMYGPDLAAAYGRGIKKVILNQNCYLTFNGYSFNKDRLISPYHHKDALATLVNSEDGALYLKHTFPNLPLYRFRLSIDPKRFKFQATKKKQLCFSRIKNQADAMQVINILKFRGALHDFDIVPFINLPQSEVAQIYQDSLLFLSFGYPEGFGLPAAEAMASGCVVIGFHGGGGKEFFNPEFSYPIEQGDILSFAKTVEEIIHSYNQNPEPILEKGRRAASYIHDTYSPELEEQEILAAWRSILEKFNSCFSI